MPTKRQYLQERGLAGARGRFSARAKDELAKAVNKGIRFTEPEDARLAEAGIGETADPRPDRPRGMYVFRNPDGTTFKRSQATACATCSYSLPWCWCVGGPTQFPYPYVPGLDGYATLTKTPPRAVITTNDVPEKQPQQGTGTRRGRGRPRKG